MRERHPARRNLLGYPSTEDFERGCSVSRRHPATVVTLSSRVAYRVNDGPAEICIFAHDEMRGLVGVLLPITNPRGLALLGLVEGQSMSIPTADGGLETLTVHEVVYQPEAARRERLKLAGGAAPGPWRLGGPVLRVVHRSDELQDKAGNKVVAAFDAGFDDPGPSPPERSTISKGV